MQENQENPDSVWLATDFPAKKPDGYPINDEEYKDFKKDLLGKVVRVRPDDITEEQLKKWGVTWKQYVFLDKLRVL